MAKALIINDRFGEQALNFYRRFPEERVDKVISIIVEQPELIRISLDTLLQSILDNWANKRFEGPDLVLVSHGNERGLTMRLFPGHRTDSRSDCLETLMRDDTTREKASKLYLKEAQVDRLVGKMNRVRTLKLGYVEFRGCNIGLQYRNLEILRKFLGAVSVSGPDLLSTYGFVTVEIAKSNRRMEAWLSKFGKEAHVSTFPEGRFAFHNNPNSHIIQAITEALAVLPLWIKKFLNKNAPNSLEGWMRARLPVHYLTDTPPIFPQEDSYVAHLRRAK
jgi:hypothetical protein